MQSSMFRPGIARVSAGAAIVLVFLTHASHVLAQNVSQSSNHPLARTSGTEDRGRRQEFSSIQIQGRSGQELLVARAYRFD